MSQINERNGHKMNKKVCLILSFLLLLMSLVGCAGENGRQSIKSSSYTPSAENEIGDSTMSGGVIYTTDVHRILAYSICDDTESIFAEGLTDCRLIDSCADSVWVYDGGVGCILEYGADGAEKRSVKFDRAAEDIHISDMAVCDGYIVFSAMAADPMLITLDLETESITKKTLEMYEYIGTLDGYGQNKVILSADTGVQIFAVFDAELLQITEEYKIIGKYANFLDYNQDNGKLYFSANGRTVAGVSSYSPEDDVLESFMRTGSVSAHDVETNNKYSVPLCVCSEDNVLAWYDGKTGSYALRDTDSQENVLRVGCVGFPISSEDAVDTLFLRYEQSSGICVREIVYSDENSMKNELMKGNSFDIFAGHDPFCIISDATENLYDFDSVAEEIERAGAGSLFSAVAETNGKLFGIPIGFRCADFADYLGLDKNGSLWEDATQKDVKRWYCQNALRLYTVRNIRLTEGRCLDGEYKELEKLLTDANKKTGITYADLLEQCDGEGKVFLSDYLMLCADSKNKDAAQKLLCEAIRLYSGQTELDYAALFEGDINCWLYGDIDITGQIYNFYETAGDSLSAYLYNALDPMLSGEHTPREAARSIGKKLDEMLKE